MNAIMLAAGEGTRCRPFTYLMPKICQQVCGIPLIEYMLSWFGGAPEIDKLYIAASNDSIAETLRAYLAKRRTHLKNISDLFRMIGFELQDANPGLEIEAVSAKGWGTGGDLRLIINQIVSSDGLHEDLFVCNADYVIAKKLPDGKLSPQLNLSDIIRYHQDPKKALNTVMTVGLVSVERETATRFGVAKLEQSMGVDLVRGFT